LDAVMPRLNRVAELQDELRECVSAGDLRKSQQKMWLLRQQHGDLGLRLSAQVNVYTFIRARRTRARATVISGVMEGL